MGGGGWRRDTDDNNNLGFLPEIVVRDCPLVVWRLVVRVIYVDGI